MEARFPPSVDAEWVEQTLQEGEGEDLQLHVGEWQGCQLFGEARLLQWLATVTWSGHTVDVILKSGLPEIEDDPRHQVWMMLRDTLGATVLIDSARSVTDEDGRDRHQEVVGVQWSRLRAEGGDVGFGRERALVAIDRRGAPAAFSAFREGVGEFDRTEQRLRSLVERLGLENVGSLPLEWLTSFARELIENTREHAITDLAGERFEGLRFLQLRRLSVAKPLQMEGLLPSAEGPVQAFLDRLSQSGDLARGQAAQFVELTVTDVGVGIPARLLDTEDVYSDPLAAELEVTLRAMRPNESSKAATVMGRGQGLHNALEVAELLRGLVVMRTGRHELLYDTTEPAPAGQDGWHIQTRGYARGTGVSVLVPWWPAAQSELAQAS